MVQAHHIRKGAGVALKPADQCAVPLCLEHHTEGHRSGWRSFELRHGIQLSDIAARLWMESNRERRGQQ